MNSQAQEFYDQHYYQELPASLKVLGHYRRLSRDIIRQSGLEILDVGCGTGEWLLACSKKAARIVGVDISEKAVGFCKRHLPQGEFYCGSADILPFKDQEFDIVSCLGCLEHFADPQLTIREMVRVAKPAADFLFLVPNSRFILRILGLYGGTQQSDFREDVRSIGEWQNIFNAAGLHVNKSWADLHVFSHRWIFLRGFLCAPVRFLVALLLCCVPRPWQYQIYFRCRKNNE